MQKSITVIICLIVIIVSEEFVKGQNNDEVNNIARKKKFKFPYYSLFYGFGFHTLAILFWIKIKVIIVALIIGAAIFWGVRHIWYYKSCSVHDSSDIISGPILSDHNHHIGYSSHEVEPFAAYPVDSSPLGIIKDFGHHHNYDNRKTWKGRQIFDENRIDDLIFSFLGIESESCKQKFLCKLKYTSNDNIITKYAFDMIAERIFFKHLQGKNHLKNPKSIEECNLIYNQCSLVASNGMIQI